MTMDRTHYNTLLNNSSPTAEDGSVWDKEDVNQLILAIDQLTDSRVELFHSTTQSLTTATFTAVTFDTEVYDVGGLHSAVNPTRVTIPSGGAGVYTLTCKIAFASNATGYRQLRVQKNGTDIGATVNVSAVNGAATVLQIHATLVLAAADYLEVVALQNSGGALNIGDTTDRVVQNELTLMKITRV